MLVPCDNEEMRLPNTIDELKEVLRRERQLERRRCEDVIQRSEEQLNNAISAGIFTLTRHEIAEWVTVLRDVRGLIHLLPDTA